MHSWLYCFASDIGSTWPSELSFLSTNGRNDRNTNNGKLKWLLPLNMQKKYYFPNVCSAVVKSGLYNVDKNCHTVQTWVPYRIVSCVIFGWKSIESAGEIYFFPYGWIPQKCIFFWKKINALGCLLYRLYNCFQKLYVFSLLVWFILLILHLYKMWMIYIDVMCALCWYVSFYKLLVIFKSYCEPPPTVAKLCRYVKLVCAKNQTSPRKSSKKCFAINRCRAFFANNIWLSLLRAWTEEKDRATSSSNNVVCQGWRRYSFWTDKFYKIRCTLSCWQEHQFEYDDPR